VAAACVGDAAWECYFPGRTLLQEQLISRVEKKHTARQIRPVIKHQSQK